MNTRENIIEVNFAKLFKSVLIQWRGILVCGLIFAVLIAGAKYMTSGGTTTTPAVSADTLTEDQEKAVKDAYTTYQEISYYEEFVENSPYMKLNPNNLTKIGLQYYVVSESGNAADILSQYMFYANSAEYAEKIIEGTDLDIAPAYYNTLIFVEVPEVQEEDSSSKVLNITLILPEGGDAGSLKTAATEAIEEYQPTGVAEDYELTLISSVVTVTNDTNVLTNQNTYSTALRNLRAAYAAAIGVFTAAQTEALNELISGDDAEVDTAAATTTSTARVFSKKFAVLGFILGVFIYLGIYVLKVVFGKKIGDYDSNVTGENEVDTLGVLLVPARKKWYSFLSRDKILCGLFYKKERNEKKQIANIASKLEFALKNNDDKKITLIQVGDELVSSESIDNFVAYAKEKGLTVTPALVNFNDVAAAYKTISNTANVVVAPECNATLSGDYSNVISIARANGSNLLGSIMLMQK